MRADDLLPPRVELALEAPVRDYWLARAAQHTQDSYAGVPMSKMPEDLRVYEHLLWHATPEVVIELGVKSGGSLLWFRDRMRTLAAYGRTRSPLVVGVDVSIEEGAERLSAADPAWRESITLVEGDLLDPALPARVAAVLPERARCLVIEDSAHEYETTTAALDGFARFVPPGGFFVVEDGCVDVEALRAHDWWPRGVLPALADWLAGPEGRSFRVRDDLELYGVSCHSGGFLERLAP